MALNANKIPGGKSYPAIEPGVYPARLVKIIDFGLQEQKPYQGKEKDPAYMINVTYEFLDEFVKGEDGEEDETKPRWISENLPLYPLTSERAKSTARYLALDPDQKYDGDWAKLIGTPCNVTISNYENAKKQTKDKVAGLAAMRPRDAKKAPELVNDPVIFDLDDPDVDVFLSFPDWIQEKIKSNLNFSGSLLEELLEDRKPDEDEPDEGDEPEEENEDEEDWGDT